MANLVPLFEYLDLDSGQRIKTPAIVNDPRLEHLVSKNINLQFQQPELKVKKLYDDAILPTRSNPDDVGLDIYSYEDVVIEPYFSPQDDGGRFKNTFFTGKPPNDSHRVLVKTGISIEIPAGWGFFLWGRSGLSANFGIHRVAGVLDPTYRDQLLVALVNLSSRDYHIKKGDRIAQAAITPVILPKIVEVDELSDTSRGDGFGSSGK